MRTDAAGAAGVLAAVDCPHESVEGAAVVEAESVEAGASAVVEAVASEFATPESLVVEVVVAAGVDQASVVSDESLVVVVSAPHAGAASFESTAVVVSLSAFASVVLFQALSVPAVFSVLKGRPFLSPPFNARGAPLVAPPRPPRTPSV